MKQGLYLAFLYLSSVIGAGFASGQELVSFFLSHGKGGYQALLFAALLFGLLGMRLFSVMGEERTESLTDFLTPRIGRVGGRIAEFLSQGFILATFIVMVSAGATLFGDTFSLPPILGALLTFFLCVLPSFWGASGLIFMGTLLVPIMVVAVSFLSTATLCTFRLPLYFEVTDTSSPFFSALLFVSYNTLTLVPVTAPFSSRMNRTSARWAGAVTTLFIAILLFLSGSALLSFPASLHAPFPLLYLATRLSPFAGQVYILLMLSSIITTGGTGAFALMNRFFPSTKKGRWRALLFLGVCSIPLSLLGFSALLNSLYPFFGVLGLLLLPAYCIK